MGLSRELPEPEEKTIQKLLFELTGVEISICPVCRKGTNETGGRNLTMAILFSEWIIGKNRASGFVIVDNGVE